MFCPFESCCMSFYFDFKWSACLCDVVSPTSAWNSVDRAFLPSLASSFVGRFSSGKIQSVLVFCIAALTLYLLPILLMGILSCTPYLVCLFWCFYLFLLIICCLLFCTSIDPLGLLCYRGWLDSTCKYCWAYINFLHSVVSNVCLRRSYVYYILTPS